MTAPIETTGVAREAHPEAIAESAGVRIEGRSLGQIAWARFRRDKVAMAGGVVIVFMVLVALFAPLITSVVGGGPTEYHDDLLDPVLNIPTGSFGGASLDHPLGLEPVNGRDIFSRIVYGARISMLVAFLATLLSVVIGVVLGTAAGYFGGWIDAVISRAMDVFLAFPLLLFAIAIGSSLQGEAFGLKGDTLRVTVLIFVIGFFSWPYIARIVRGQTLSLREREFVEAARSLGATDRHIIFRELMPNLVGPILVYSTLLIPTNILFEAALSFLGVGVQEPTASWGGMLARAVPRYEDAPMFMVVPGVTIFITVLAFNLLGDGLRDALDPRSR
ncbi:ABC transporter permease [Embleya sp. NBC_00896]|uniref:ABC transporter permease n=1 Tax=Embleya sp. NBC_00896 TaxID=2975961 RepID=UPI0038645901|nr:ABC transporter permease [Embleya sp. NBC_00896]